MSGVTMKKNMHDHPLTRSKWLWPEGYVYLNNCHAQFRHDFILNELPEKAPFFITADQAYRLYINGIYVCRGPARGYQSHWPYDECDVRSFLRTGPNFISVEAYNPGIGTFQYLHQSAAGFICAAEWDDVRIHTNKDTWQMRRAPGNNPNVARLSVQMGWQEDFDAGKDDLSWIYSHVKPEWPPDNIFSPFDVEIAFGKQPWATLEKRGIPMLREELLVPKEVTAHGIGVMQPGYRETANPAWHWNGQESSTVKDWRLPFDSQLSDDGLGFAADPVHEGQFRAITVNMGAIVCGSLILDVEGCTGREIIDCHYHQWLSNDTPEHLIPAGNGGLLALCTRLRTRPGASRRMFYPMMGARLITLVFREVTQALKVNVSWMTAEYPFTMRGRFETSDPQLNQIYELCRHTQQICSTDAYVDTPWREQGQWWADARIQAKNTIFLDGDIRLLERGIRSVAEQPTTNGLTYGVAPCCVGNCVLPDFALAWVLTVYDHYFQTGSLDLFREQHERIRGVFEYFETEAASNGEGILKYDAKLWLFEDWADLPKVGYPTFLNLWYLHTLEHYEKMLAAAKEEDERKHVARKIVGLRTRLSAFFFDDQDGLFLPGRNFDGTPTGIPSVHDQVLAILLDLRPDCHEMMAQKRILPFLRGANLECAVPSAFWCSYVFDAAQLLGYRRETLDFIRREWGKMIPYGGTWEHLIFNEDEGFSCSHGWSAHPAFHLTELLCGLRQTAPGWQGYEYDPALELLPANGVISVPLPQGDLRFEWKNGEFKAELIKCAVRSPHDQGECILSGITPLFSPKTELELICEEKHRARPAS
jgi:hypothetical protein